MGDAEEHRLAYRPEIDGLRAIAVLAVIVNHAVPSWLPGGYQGVDLFFVISGYLITGILLKDLAAGRFSILQFYERRVRRIIPALMLVMLLCIPFAAWLDLPDGLENFGQSLVATSFFANNILLMLTSGYFELEAGFKPLLHTWSLGVEEQYYLLVPLLMWGAWRIGKARGVAIAIAAVTVTGMIFGWLTLHHAWLWNFFMITSRAWELGAGALAVLAEPRLRASVPKGTAQGLAALGLVMAVVALPFDRGQNGPALFALIPVTGMCLMLMFGSTGGPAGQLLTLPPLVWIGLVSYSAYLFHQPIFAFTRLVRLEPPPAWLMLALIVPVFLLAWLSWRFVEQPFRDRRRIGTRALLAGWGAATLVVVGAGLTFHLTSGFYGNWPELAVPGTGYGHGANIAYNLGPERFRDLKLPDTKTGSRVLVIGNSFGRDFINAGLESGNLDPNAISLEEYGDCGRLPPPALENVKRADFIILATQFMVPQVPCIVRRVANLRRMTSVPVVVIGRKSFGWNNNAVMFLPAAERASVRVKPIDEAVEANDAARRALPPANYVDVIALIGDAQGRVPVFTPDNKFISQDARHLTQPGAAYLGPILFRHPLLAPIAAAVHAKAAPAKP